jgi:hypothetical protein
MGAAKQATLWLVEKKHRNHAVKGWSTDCFRRHFALQQQRQTGCEEMRMTDDRLRETRRMKTSHAKAQQTVERCREVILLIKNNRAQFNQRNCNGTARWRRSTCEHTPLLVSCPVVIELVGFEQTESELRTCKQWHSKYYFLLKHDSVASQPPSRSPAAASQSVSGWACK